MKRITVTIDKITENKMDIIIGSFGMSKSEFIRRAVDYFYSEQKKMWPGAIEQYIEKLKEE